MGVMIRSADVADAAAIAAVQARGVAAAYGDLLPARVKRVVLEPADHGGRPGRLWEEWLRRSKVSTVVAVDGEEMVGFSTLHPMSGGGEATGELVAIYVDPPCWRRGVGRLLCEQTLAEARARGFEEVVAWVLEVNARARGFYDALGFRSDGEKRIFLEHAATQFLEVRYRRDLASS